MAQLRAELLKLRTTRTTISLLAAMIGLVLTAVVLHGYGLTTEDLDSASKQLTLLAGWGVVLGALFAGLLGAMSFTGEIRYGTIRPTLLVTPRRGRVIAAKSAASMLGGIAFGLAATAVAAVAASVALTARGVDVRLDVGDFALLIFGGSVAAALWAVIGLGVGALVRNQMPAVVGLLAWVLFIEGQLIDNAPDLGRLAPGPLSRGISGMDPDILLAPGLAALLLVHYALAAAAAGRLATTRRDFV